MSTLLNSRVAKTMCIQMSCPANLGIEMADMPVATPAPPASREAIPVPDIPAINYRKPDTSYTYSDLSVQDPTLQTSTLEKFERGYPLSVCKMPQRLYYFYQNYERCSRHWHGLRFVNYIIAVLIKFLFSHLDFKWGHLAFVISHILCTCAVNSFTMCLVGQACCVYYSNKPS